MGKYYIYFAFVKGTLKYVGKGSGSRWKHCCEGTSSIKELNRDYFNGDHIEVYKSSSFNTSKDAEEVENKLISHMKLNIAYDLYNKKYKYIENNSILDSFNLKTEFVGCSCDNAYQCGRYRNLNRIIDFPGGITYSSQYIMRRRFEIADEMYFGLSLDYETSNNKLFAGFGHCFGNHFKYPLKGYLGNGEVVPMDYFGNT